MKQIKGNHGVKFLTTLLVLTGSLISVNLAAENIYRWTDENGVVHFGDRPPEGQQAQAIPIPDAPPSEAADNDMAPEQSDAPVPGEESNDASVEEEPVPLTAAQARRAKMAKDREERQIAQAEIDTMCQKHRKRVEQMEPYRRVFYTNEQGESVRMDDDLRIQLVEESKAYIAENCE